MPGDDTFSVAGLCAREWQKRGGAAWVFGRSGPETARSAEDSPAGDGSVTARSGGFGIVGGSGLLDRGLILKRLFLGRFFLRLVFRLVFNGGRPLLR